MSSSGATLLSIYVSKFESLFKAVRKTAEMRGGEFGILRFLSSFVSANIFQLQTELRKNMCGTKRNTPLLHKFSEDGGQS